MTRTPQPTPDILDVAAVVTGEQRIRLTGWQFEQAISAMAALGHSTRHISYCTLRREDRIRHVAAELGIHLNRYDRRPDWFAIDMVVTGSAQMHLLDADRAEAIRVMAARGLDSFEMGRRLLCDPANVRRFASRIGVSITRDAAGWDRMRRNQPARRQQQQAVAA